MNTKRVCSSTVNDEKKYRYADFFPLYNDTRGQIMIIKQLISKRLENDNQAEKVYSFIASTDRADRYGDIINQSGWELDSYERNPILLLNHEHNSLPIGRGKVRIAPEGLIIDVEFDMEDSRAAEIAGKVERGFLNAVSVGFTPLKAISRASLAKDHAAYSDQGGSYFEKAELLEVSIVTIPANSDATAIAAKSYDEKIKSMIQEEVRSSLASLPSSSVLKHILEVREDEDSFTIIFAKPPGIEEESGHDMKEDEEEMMMDKEEEEEMKEYEQSALIKALLSIQEK